MKIGIHTQDPPAAGERHIQRAASQVPNFDDNYDDNDLRSVDRQLFA